MPLERPLLISPAGVQTSFRKPSVRGGGASNRRKARQVDVLGPKLAALAAAFEAKRAVLQLSADGVPVEQVVVFETNGPVRDLYEAVRAMSGLEWLADEDLRDLDPDEDFFIKNKPGKLVGAQLYLVLFSQQALDQLLSLWSLWSTGKRLPKQFEVWRILFAQLRDVRRWSSQDRLQETRILDSWRERVAQGYETVFVEVELWFRSAASRRIAASRVSQEIVAAGGQVLSTCEVEAIAYHALVAKLPIRTAEQVLASEEVALLQCDEVRLLRPVGQAGAPIVDGDLDGAAIPESLPATLGDPVVALLDGLPLERHIQLSGRLVVDDPDGWAETYPVANRGHGTAMASLILHGDLSAAEKALPRKLYVRPILRPFGNSEAAPEEQSWIDVIHRAVRRMVRGDGNEPPAAPGVAVINLSIGDPYQPFIRTVSPLARLLDWLAWDYGVLFIVSAGNYRNFDVDTDLDATDEEKHDALLKSLVAQQRHRRLLSPAESVNALTVGATQGDASDPTAADSRLLRFALGPGLPSPISALGRGFRRSVKPDVLAAGGGVAFETSAAPTGGYFSCNAALRPRTPPGHRVAAPGSTGDVGHTRFVCGTSNAAAMTTRLAAKLIDVLHNLSDEPNADELRRVPTALWVKALIAHGASWTESSERTLQRLLSAEANKYAFSDHMTGVLGFGETQQERVLDCLPHRATILAAGSIAVDETFTHIIPLPASLNAHVAWRRLTITMAWFTPTNPTHRKYRRAAVWFDPPTDGGPLAVKRHGPDWRAVKRGTLQHEVLEGTGQAINIDPDGALRIPVSCTAEAGELDERIRYALAVTLEVAPGVNSRIYDEIRNRVAAKVPLKAPRSPS